MPVICVLWYKSHAADNAVSHAVVSSHHFLRGVKSPIVNRSVLLCAVCRQAADGGPSLPDGRSWLSAPSGQQQCSVLDHASELRSLYQDGPSKRFLTLIELLSLRLFTASFVQVSRILECVRNVKGSIEK